MNKGDGWGSGGRSPASGHRGNRQSPGAVDRSLDESSGNSGRGSRRGGRRPSLSPRNNSPLQVYVRKTTQVSNVRLVEKAARQEIKSQEDEVGSTKQPDEGASFKCSGDDKDPLQPPASSSSKNITLSGGSSVPRECEDVKDVARMSCDLVNRGFYQPGYRDGASFHLKMMCLGKNWDPQTSRYGETRPHDGAVPPKIPVEFNQFVQKAIQDSRSLVASTSSKKTKGEVEIPFMSPDICIANFYTSTGRLGLHQDKDESEKSIENGLPVVSFSIGDSAEFVFSDQRNDDKTETVVLKSGDVLLFGGKSRKVFHGVRSILKDTAPTVLVQETSLRQGRLNLTFRQY